MKKQLLICLLAFYSISSFAQDRAMLTKEETINYINKKLNEIVGHYRTVKGTGNVNHKFYFLDTQSVSLSGSDVKIDMHRSNFPRKQYGKEKWISGMGSIYYYPCDYLNDTYILKFNPAHIKDIEIGPNYVSGEPVGVIRITLIGKTATQTKYTYHNIKYTETSEGRFCHNYGENESLRQNLTVSEIYMTYLQSDTTNFNKLRKAFEHLRDLCKAEDDPFGDY